MKKYNEINLGDTATVIRTITDADIKKFVELTGDDNKLHINKEFAKKTELKKPVVHEMLGASFISTLIDIIICQLCFTQLFLITCFSFDEKAYLLSKIL